MDRSAIIEQEFMLGFLCLRGEEASMKKRFTEEQIIRILQEAGHSANTRDVWRNKYSSMKISETQRQIPLTWVKWCGTGKHGKGTRKKNAVLKCLKGDHVRGYFSDITLRPDLEPTDSMYPSMEHLIDPSNHSETVVEARVINDMKSHLSEDEFWQVVEHLFIVGIEKGRIRPPFGKRLPKIWSPAKHYKKKNAEQSGAANGSQ